MRAWWLLLVASCLVGCGLVVSTDHYDTSDRTPPAYAVRGVVDGLGAAMVTLMLNGGSPIVVPNGPFAFPAVLRDRAPYAVTTGMQPAGHACSLERAAGMIAGSDAGDVAVHCASTNAILDALSISAGTLTPAFAPLIFDYRVELKVPSTLFAVPPRAVSVTATAHDPTARVTITSPTKTAGSSGPIALGLGSNPIDVSVQAADPTTSPAHYRIDVFGYASDYLKADSPTAESQFGSAVAIDGDTLAVGAFGESSLAPSAGAVYMFARKNGAWTQTSIVHPPVTKPSMFFGAAVALRGDTLVVGAPGESGNATGVGGDPTSVPEPPCDDPNSAICFERAGAVFVYRRRADGTWAPDAYLKALDPGELGQFGNAVALDGDTLAAGAFTAAKEHGRVYLFTRDPTTKAWSTGVTELSATTTPALGHFGYTVALEGDTLAVGAPLSGDVFVYTRSAGTWTDQNAMLHETGSFGSALGLSKGTLAIGAETDASSGAVHVYVGSGGSWTKQAYLKASNARTDALFGNTLALLGNTLAVGSVTETSDARGIGGDQGNASMAAAGAAYFFVRSGATWSQKAYVKASNTQPNAWFGGSSIALSADTLIAGAQQESSRARGINGKPQDDTSTHFAGAVFAF